MTCHVVKLLARTMEPVSVDLNGKAAVFGTFDNEINLVSAYLNLRLHVVGRRPEGAPSMELLGLFLDFTRQDVFIDWISVYRAELNHERISV